MRMATKKNVYFFGAGKADGKAKMKNLLGGKGANLAEMSSLGIPVPAGFTITTDVCMAYYENKGRLSKPLEAEVKKVLAKVEAIMGKKYGSPKNPLLLSTTSWNVTEAFRCSSFSPLLASKGRSSGAPGVNCSSLVACRGGISVFL